MRRVVSIGVAAALGPDLVAKFAPAIEQAGFHALWVNDIPGADALAVLEAAARVTTHLTLSTGVLPVDRRSAESIIAAVQDRSLPQARLVVGIGAGDARSGALALVADAAAQLRDALDARIVVGAVAPRMRRLAAEHADGSLLSWLTPQAATEHAAEARAAASGTHVALYVRTAFDVTAADRLSTEMRRYGAIPSYSANFARHEMPIEETVLDAGARPVGPRLAEYRAAVDEVVLRAITPADDLDHYLQFIEAASELL